MELFDGIAFSQSFDQIEDLRDAVLGAGLEARQYSLGRIGGQLSFAATEKMHISSGKIIGKVSLRGTLSDTDWTIGACLKTSNGSRHWGGEIESGTVGVFQPNGDHDAIYATDSEYLGVNLSMEALENAARLEDLTLDKNVMTTGKSLHPLSPTIVKTIRQALRQSELASEQGPRLVDAGELFVRCWVNHFGRAPKGIIGTWKQTGHERIFKRAREFVEEHLHEPISVDELALAAMTSRRTLFRAFLSIAGVSPYDYVQQTRLNRVRQDLLKDLETPQSIATLANNWGLDQPGRFSRMYREMFDELPSQTRIYSMNTLRSA